MRTFDQLRSSQDLTRVADAALGPVYFTLSDATGGRRVRVFDDPADVGPYVTLHELAHLWVHRDYDHDAWFALAVDEPVEIGVDFVVMPRRHGNTLDSFVRDDDRADPPPRLAELRSLMPKLIAAAADAKDAWIAQLVAGRLATADVNTVFVWADDRFYIEDLAPSRAELRAWRELSRGG